MRNINIKRVKFTIYSDKTDDYINNELIIRGFIKDKIDFNPMKSKDREKLSKLLLNYLDLVEQNVELRDDHLQFSNQKSYEFERLERILAESEQTNNNSAKEIEQYKHKIHSLEQSLKEEKDTHKTTRHQLSLSKSLTQSISKQNNQDLKRRQAEQDKRSGVSLSGPTTSAQSDDLLDRALLQSKHSEVKLTQENAQWRDLINDLGGHLSELATDATRRVELLTEQTISIDNPSNKPPRATLSAINQTKDRLILYVNVLKTSIKRLSGQKTFNFVDDYDFDKLDVIRQDYITIKANIDQLFKGTVGTLKRNQDETSEGFKPRRSNRLNLSDLTTNYEDNQNNEDDDKVVDLQDTRPTKITKIDHRRSSTRRPSAAAGNSKLAEARIRG